MFLNFAVKKIALLLVPVGVMFFAWEKERHKEEEKHARVTRRVQRSTECELSFCTRPENIVDEPDFAVGYSEEFVGHPTIDEDAVLRLVPLSGDSEGWWCAHYREVPSNGRFSLRVRPLLGLELHDLHIRCFAEDGRRWKTRPRSPVSSGSLSEFIVDLH